MSTTVEYSSQNWFQGEGNAIVSMCGGCVGVVVLSLVIFMNENNYVKSIATADLLTNAVDVSNCKYDPANDDHLVYVHGCNVVAPQIGATVSNLAANPSPFLNSLLSGSSLETPSVQMTVEIMQWYEHCEETSHTQKDNQGGTQTVTVKTCDGRKRWQSSLPTNGVIHIRNSNKRFLNAGNIPRNLPAGSETISCKDNCVQMGADGFVLPEESVEWMSDQNVVGEARIDTNSRGVWNGNGDAQQNMVTRDDGYLYIRYTNRNYYNGCVNDGNCVSPGIGDIRITLTAKVAHQASMAAEQRGLNFGPWPPQKFNFFGQTTNEVERVKFDQDRTVEQFIDDWKSESSSLLWIIRLVAFILMFAAWSCIFQPLSVMADLLRILNYCTCCIGSILDNAAQCVISMVSCGFACCCFTFVFIVAWFVARPLYAVLGLVIMVGLGVSAAVFHFTQGKKAGGRMFALVEPLGLDSPACEYIKVAV
jgi:hypothetical protein